MRDLVEPERFARLPGNGQVTIGTGLNYRREPDEGASVLSLSAVVLKSRTHDSTLELNSRMTRFSL